MVAKRKKVTKVTRPAKKAARTKKVTRAKKSAAKKPAARRATKAVDPYNPTRPAIMADVFAARREILATVDRELCEVIDTAIRTERHIMIAGRVLPELVARDFGPEEAADLALDYADALLVKARERKERDAARDTKVPPPLVGVNFAGEEDTPDLSAPVPTEPAILEPASVN